MDDWVDYYDWLQLIVSVREYGFDFVISLVNDIWDGWLSLDVVISYG
jgi:hypothetical protein